MEDYQKQLEQLLEITIIEKASDLHISEGHFPTLRMAGRLVPLLKMKKLSPGDSRALAEALMEEENKENTEETKENQGGGTQEEGSTQEGR